MREEEKVYTNLLVVVVVVESSKFEIIIVCVRRASEMSHFRSHVEGTLNNRSLKKTKVNIRNRLKKKIK